MYSTHKQRSLKMIIIHVMGLRQSGWCMEGVKSINGDGSRFLGRHKFVTWYILFLTRHICAAMMTSSNWNIYRVNGSFPSQRPVTRSFHIFFDLRLNRRFSKESRRRWFETPSRSLCHHRNGVKCITWYKYIYQYHQRYGSSEIVRRRKYYL